MLEVLFKALTERVWNLVKSDEFLDLLHLCVIACGAGVEALDDGAHVTEYARIHQRWSTQNADSFYAVSEKNVPLYNCL